MDIYINKYLCDFLLLPLHGESDKRLFVKTRKKAKPDRKHQTLSNSWKWLGSGKKKKRKKRNCTELSPLSFTLNGLESGESLRPWSLRVTINSNFSGRCCCSVLTLRTAPSLYCLFPWDVFAHSQLNHVRLHFSKTNTKKESMLNFANSCTGKTVIEREWLNEWKNTAQELKNSFHCQSTEQPHCHGQVKKKVLMCRNREQLTLLTFEGQIIYSLL